jgi:hypothetical protein
MEYCVEVLLSASSSECGTAAEGSTPPVPNHVILQDVEQFQLPLIFTTHFLKAAKIPVK